MLVNSVRRRIETLMSRAAYEIRAAGEVPAQLLDDFVGVTVVVDPVGTTIHADLADEAELHGLLDALRREGFPLIDVRRDPSVRTAPRTTVARPPRSERRDRTGRSRLRTQAPEPRPQLPPVTASWRAARPGARRTPDAGRRRALGPPRDAYSQACAIRT